MLTFNHSLILFLLFLLCLLISYYLYQSQNNSQDSIKEGLDSSKDNINIYNNYDKNSMSSTDNALMLAQQNAGNIEYLKQQISKITTLDKEVQDMSGNLVTLNEQMIALVNQQTQAASQLAGNKPLETTGLSSAPEASADTTISNNMIDSNSQPETLSKTNETNETNEKKNVPSIGSSSIPSNALTNNSLTIGSSNISSDSVTNNLSSNISSKSATNNLSSVGSSSFGSSSFGSSNLPKFSLTNSS
jgi:uncharacterized protein (UPF0333 family)